MQSTTFVIEASALAFKEALVNLDAGFYNIKDGSITLLPFLEGRLWDREAYYVSCEEALPGDIRIAGTKLILRSEPVEDWSGTILAVDHDRKTTGVAVGFKWVQLDDKLQVTITCLEEAAKPLVERLLDKIGSLWPESGLAGWQKEKRNPYGATEKTIALAHDIKAVKEKHPTWSQSRVATELNLPVESVRNAYRLMGWKWQRADRVRRNR